MTQAYYFMTIGFKVIQGTSLEEDHPFHIPGRALDYPVTKFYNPSSSTYIFLYFGIIYQKTGQVRLENGESELLLVTCFNSLPIFSIPFRIG